LILAAPAVAGDGPTIPLEWQGIWDITSITRIPCETGAPIQSTDTDTLCVGDRAFDSDGDGVEVECTGTVSGTSFDITCTSTDTFDECEVTVVTTHTGTRTGDTYMATSTIVSTAVDPKLCGFDEFCVESTTTGVRTSSDPGVCAITPVEERSWGSIKTEYR
jgi:hypothetical protein